MASFADELYGKKPYTVDDALASEGVTGKAADFFKSIYQQESSSGKNTATSNRGAVGGAQIIPSTFKSVADDGWDIKNPEHNLRAGIRYAMQGFEKANGNPELAGAFYYGGPNGLKKAMQGVAVSDPINPNAPNTLQYGAQVAARMLKSAPRSLYDELYGDTSAKTSEAPAKPLDVTAKPDQSLLDQWVQLNKNVGGGLIRGAGSLGATAMRILPNALGGDTAQENEQRRKSMDAALTSLGADTNSIPFSAGKIGAEIAGTAGVGGALAAGMRAIPIVSKYAPSLIEAVGSFGFKGGAIPQTALEGAKNVATRAVGGSAAGGVGASAVDPNDALLGAAVGGGLPVVAKGAMLAGGITGAAIRKMAGGEASPEIANLAKRAKDLGIDVPADRLVNSRPLNAMAASLNYVPFSGRAATEDLMNSQLNKALSNTFGQDSTNVTMALRKASSKLGAEFDTALKGNNVIVDTAFQNDIASVYKKAESELGADLLKPIKNQIDTLMDKGSSGAIDGQAAYNIKRELDRLGKGNTPTAYHALQLKDALMGAFDRSLGQNAAEAFATTRQQYGNMRALEKLAKNGVDGELSAARIANLPNINNQPLQEIADIAAQFVKPREGMHGASQRVALGSLFAGAINPAAIPALAGGMAAGRAANTMLNSNALKNILLNNKQQGMQSLNSPEMQNALQLLTRSAPALSAQ